MDFNVDSYISISFSSWNRSSHPCRVKFCYSSSHPSLRVHLKFSSERQIKRSVEWFDHTSDWLEVAVGRCTCGLELQGALGEVLLAVLCYSVSSRDIMIWMKYAVGVYAHAIFRLHGLACIFPGYLERKILQSSTKAQRICISIYGDHLL